MLGILFNSHFRFCHTRPSAQWLAQRGGFSEDGVSDVIGLRHSMMRFGRQTIQNEIHRLVSQGSIDRRLAETVLRRADEDVAIGINYLNDTFEALIAAGVLF